MNSSFFINASTPISDNLLRLIAHIPTKSLSAVVDAEFTAKLSDENFMRIAVWLAQKSYDEGGCPIGGVIIENKTRQIWGKGHNTLVQESHPYNHGETSAIRDAGRRDFSQATIFTTLTPCDVCATLCYMRGFKRVVIGNSPNPTNNEAMLRGKGIQVDLLIDAMGVDLYKKYQQEKPNQDLEDWQGLAAVVQKAG